MLKLFRKKSNKQKSKIPIVYPLSSRGIQAANTKLRIDWDIFSEATQNLYHKKANPSGAFTLNVAENRLSWPLLKKKIEKTLKNKSIPDWVPLYTSCLGAPSFRKVLAEFLSKFLTRCPISSDHLAISSGASSVIEITSFLIAEKGDVAVIPSPSYPVYTQDLGNKSGVERYDLITHHELSEIGQIPKLEIFDLNKAKREIETKGKRFRMLIITSPDNPTGGMYSQQQLHAITDWCINNRIHLIVNEIYGLSLINTDHKTISADYLEKREFVSFAQIMASKKSNFLHMWYALSKDLGVSGFRIGALHTYNEDLLKAYDNFNVPHLVSNFTQWVFEEVLSDQKFMTKYIKKNQKVLTNSYVEVIKVLKRLDIPYVPSRGSLFVWLDLSKYLTTPTQEAETAFWEKLYENTGVLLTPGNGFGHSKRGQFRLVYPCHSKKELKEAMKRMENYLTGLSKIS